VSTRKVVINDRHGGFSLSAAAVLRMRELGSEAAHKHKLSERRSFGEYLDVPRDDPLLVQVVEEMGDAASGSLAALTAVEIPADVEWEIAEFDGLEHVAEKHRTWYAGDPPA
jgi:hypothetical protein